MLAPDLMKTIREWSKSNPPKLHVDAMAASIMAANVGHGAGRQILFRLDPAGMVALLLEALDQQVAINMHVAGATVAALGGKPLPEDNPLKTQHRLMTEAIAKAETKAREDAEAKAAELCYRESEMLGEAITLACNKAPLGDNPNVVAYKRVEAAIEAARKSGFDNGRAETGNITRNFVERDRQTFRDTVKTILEARHVKTHFLEPDPEPTRPTVREPVITGAEDETRIIPRRCDIHRNTAAELAIRQAAQAVEALPADPILTDAVMLLNEARMKVADYVDAHPNA